MSASFVSPAGRLMNGRAVCPNWFSVAFRLSACCCPTNCQSLNSPTLNLGITERNAGELFVWPTGLLNATEYDPLSFVETLISRNGLFVAPSIGFPLKYHW